MRLSLPSLLHREQYVWEELTQGHMQVSARLTECELLFLLSKFKPFLFHPAAHATYNIQFKTSDNSRVVSDPLPKTADSPELFEYTQTAMPTMTLVKYSLEKMLFIPPCFPSFSHIPHVFLLPTQIISPGLYVQGWCLSKGTTLFITASNDVHYTQPQKRY